MSYHSGFVALVGKPNVGKSTLVNKLVGRKVAITSSKPQTTRQRMLGVLHGEDYQAVLVDTPGMMKAKTALHRSMIGAATQEAEGADLVLWLVEATHLPTDEDETVAKLVRTMQSRRPGWLVITKVDKEKEGVADACRALLPEAAQVHEISAKTGKGVAELVTALRQALPEGPPYFPPDQVSEQNDRLWMAEVIREKVLRATRQEVPHSVAVTVEELREGKGGEGSLYGRAILYVEKNSQKGILIGKDGALL
ncbi:MAG: GTPase Era, partial [Candidatus Eremiobacteraeota bacterium]|nr:GTPase Era [Candidatus Eremiobacteraeota bacterium]